MVPVQIGGREGGSEYALHTSEMKDAVLFSATPLWTPFHCPSPPKWGGIQSISQRSNSEFVHNYILQQFHVIILNNGFLQYYSHGPCNRGPFGPLIVLWYRVGWLKYYARTPNLLFPLFLPLMVSHGTYVCWYASVAFSWEWEHVSLGWRDTWRNSGTHKDAPLRVQGRFPQHPSHTSATKYDVKGTYKLYQPSSTLKKNGMFHKFYMCQKSHKYSHLQLSIV